MTERPSPSGPTAPHRWRADHVEELSLVSAPSLGIPHDANAAVLDALRGGRAEWIDGPVVPVA